MKHIIKIFLLIASTQGLGQGQPPISPLTEAVFSASVKDQFSPTGSMLPKGKWAYDVTIQNLNDKPIFCRNAYFKAPLDTWGNSCANGDYSMFVPVGPNNATTLELAANSSIKIPLAGNTEREKRERDIEVNKDKDLDNDVHLEICNGREPIALNCGYICEGGVKHEDEITTNEKNAAVTKLCLATGKFYVKKVVCSDTDKYQINAEQDGCVPKSCGSRPHGPDEWSVPVQNGTAYYTCNYGSEKYSRTVCKDDTYFEQSGINCKPKTVTFQYFAKQLHTQCKMYDSFPSLPSMTPSYVCDVNQYLAFGPFINLPYPGYVSAKFFIFDVGSYSDRLPKQIPAANAPIAIFDIYSAPLGRVFGEKVLRIGDLERFTVNQNIGTFDLRYTGGIPAAGQMTGRSVTIEAEITKPALDVEFRVQYVQVGDLSLNPPRTSIVATRFTFSGVEINYTPYP